MHIKSGLFNHMVMQRAAGNVCDTIVTGTATADGSVTATVLKGKGGKVFANRVIGRAQKGVFSARVRGLPAGGPYNVQLSICNADGTAADQITVKDVLVGDVWLLGGQSNMQGSGRANTEIKAHSLVRAFYMNDEWDIARDPIHNLNEAVDTVHNGWPDPDKPRKRSRRIAPCGAGPGVPFGLSMLQRTGVPQGLIACAHGGTSMAQWDPALKKEGSKSLYGAMCRRFNKNGARVAGVVWYQGESDAGNEAAALFTRRMRRLINAMRRDFHNPALPFVMVQLARFFGHAPSVAPDAWNRIQEIQRLLPGIIKHCATVPAIDLPLDDLIHVSGEGMLRLGPRLAEAMAGLRRVPNAGKPPIAFKGIGFSKDRIYGNVKLQVRFDNVVGRFVAAGEPTGFALISPAGANAVYRVELHGNTATLRLTEFNSASKLYYGCGYAPFCNITDEADRALPVFGPVLLSTPSILRRILRDLRNSPVLDSMGVTPFATRVLVSKPLPAPADRLQQLDYPGQQRALQFKAREFAGVLWNLHEDVFNCAPKNLMVYFKCALVCPQSMKLEIGVGYDGPIKMWINRREVLHDPAGTNPAGEDKAVVKFNALRGRHELLFALTSNFGKAWGIKVRCRRRDLTAKQLARPQSYSMPKWTA